jgi:hypothetical protein
MPAARPRLRAAPRAYVTPNHPRLLSRSWRRDVILLAILLLVACAPQPVQRPREGAPPSAGGTPARLENAVPPTLSAGSGFTQTAMPTVVPGSSPGIASSPVPVRSPGLSPIISGLQPVPGAALPPGDIVIGARISGSTNLVDVSAFVDGEAVEIEPIGPSVRVKTISFVRNFGGGTHEVRILARDDRNQSGGYRWQFTVSTPRQAAPSPPPLTSVPPTSAVQTRTPIDVPTRRPTMPSPTPPGPSPTR